MTITAEHIPYNQIGPQVKYSDLENRISRRVLNSLYGHPLYLKIDTHYSHTVFSLAGKPQEGIGKVNIDEIDELDLTKEYNARHVIALDFQESFLIDAEVVVVGLIRHDGRDWVLEARSWEHNIISRQANPSCEELLFHARDFSKGMMKGGSMKSPWHHQWHVTTKKKLENEKSCNFIWKPHLFEETRNGIYKMKRWYYKNYQYQSIDEFKLKEFFDLCEACSTSGILRDRSYYISL